MARCGCAEAWCVCALDPGHDGPHVCECGGSWEFDEGGRFRSVAWPGVTR